MEPSNRLQILDFRSSRIVKSLKKFYPIFIPFFFSIAGSDLSSFQQTALSSCIDWVKKVSIFIFAESRKKYYSFFICVFGEEPWSSGTSQGSKLKSCEFKTPTEENIFALYSFRSKYETPTWHCSMWCNPANGRVDIEERLAFKTQLHGGN